MGCLALENGSVQLRLNEFADQPGVWMLVVDGEIARLTGADTRTMRESAKWWQRSEKSDGHNHLLCLLHRALDAGQAVDLFGCQPDGGNFAAMARDWRRMFSFAWT